MFPTNLFNMFVFRLTKKEQKDMEYRRKQLEYAKQYQNAESKLKIKRYEVLCYSLVLTLSTDLVAFMRDSNGVPGTIILCLSVFERR